MSKKKAFGPNFLDEDDLSEVEEYARVDRGEYRRRREFGKRRGLSVGEVTRLDDLGRDSFIELWRDNDRPIDLFER